MLGCEVGLTCAEANNRKEKEVVAGGVVGGVVVECRNTKTYGDKHVIANHSSSNTDDRIINIVVAVVVSKFIAKIL